LVRRISRREKNFKSRHIKSQWEKRGGRTWNISGKVWGGGRDRRLFKVGGHIKKKGMGVN